MQAPADPSAMPPPRNTRADRPARCTEERQAPELKQPGKKRTSAAGVTDSTDLADKPVAASKVGLDEQDAKRQRRLEQNRIAAKKAYDKRVKRQADMEQEYQRLCQQLQETNAQAATLSAFISQAGLTGQSRSGEETPPLGQLSPKSARRSRQPTSTERETERQRERQRDREVERQRDRENPGVGTTAQAPVAAGRPAETVRSGGPQYRRVQSIEALTSLVSMVDESSGSSP